VYQRNWEDENTRLAGVQNLTLTLAGIAQAGA